MAVVHCEKGHYYDNEKFEECPHCKKPLPIRPKRGMNDDLTVFGSSNEQIAAAGLRQPMQVSLGNRVAPNAEEKTVGIFRAKTGYEAVVGWFVCVAGKEKGRDFRLHAGRNFVGRSLNSDISLVDDERISREDHCSIVFEPKQSIFMLVRGVGDGVQVNDISLNDTYQLIGEEKIVLGGSEFVFVPFCKEGRTW